MKRTDDVHDLAAGGSEYPDLDPDEMQFLESILQRDSDSKKKMRVINEASQAVQASLRYRLAGWSPDGQQIAWDDDIEAIRAIEKPLVISPEAIQEEFGERTRMTDEQLRSIDKLNPDLFPFTTKGGHVNLASKEKLMMVRRAGLAIVAELEMPTGRRVPLGYSYGLDKMPYKDNEFPNLDADSLLLPPDEKEMAILEREKTLAIWRTSVREKLSAEELKELGIGMESLSLRRLAIGSALKYIMIRQAQLREKVRVTLNVGTLTREGDEMRMPNMASDLYNSNFLMQWGWRSYTTPIEIRGEKGLRTPVAKMHWMAYKSRPNVAIDRLTEDGGVLKRKGMDINMLEDVAVTVTDQIKHEQNIGDHDR